MQSLLQQVNQARCPPSPLPLLLKLMTSLSCLSPSQTQRGAYKFDRLLDLEYSIEHPKHVA